MRRAAPPIVVAIPARNEADSIGTALAALAALPGARRQIAAVIVHANNCTDSTAAVARALAVTLPWPLTVIEGEAIHIGHARRTVTEAAMAHLHRIGRPDGIIASTDADSRVAPGWLAALAAAFTPDIDAVCGTIALDGPVAPGLAAARRAEADHAAATAAIADLFDPIDHDPWPRHIWSWGANIAVRADTLARVGGVPLVDLAEDRALHAMLLRGDARIRHAPGVRVLTSARAQGRAPGGFADLLAEYAADPDALADFALEPAAITRRRAAERGQARQAWGPQPGFGAFWADHEARAPHLARQRIAIRDLPAHTRLLQGWIRVAARRSDNPVSAPATGSAPPAAARQ